MGKIIQIVVSAGTNGDCDILYALTEDGEVYRLKVKPGSSWELVDG